MAAIAAGAPAPAFRLARADGESFSERDLRGTTTVLVFYPFAFSPVCTDQLQLYEGILGELSEQGAVLYGVSCDSPYAQSAFQDKLGVSSEQLSDFEPKGAACAAFGVLHPGGFPSARCSSPAPTASSAGAMKRPPRASCRASSCCARALPPRSAKLRSFGKREKETDRRPTGGT